jgi:hypothetical protein
MKASHTGTDFNDAGTELVSKQLEWSIGFESSFDTIIRQCRNPKRQLGLCHAGLDAQWFHKHVPRSQLGWSDFFETKITEPVKTPCSHWSVPLVDEP